MAILKNILFLFCLIVLVQSEDLASRPITKLTASKLVGTPKETRATVIGSNLPLNDQYELAEELQHIYDTVGNPVNRAVEFSDILDRKYPYTRNNVVIDYAAIVYYQTYYIIFSVQGEQVIAFGL